MRDHFFLHYGWFFQNLRKEAVRTFMHTTVVQFTTKSGTELCTKIVEPPRRPGIFPDDTCPSSIPKSHPVVLESLSPRPQWPYDTVYILADSEFFKNFLYQGGVKSTVSWGFEDLKFKISEGYNQNWCFPDSAQLAVSV